MVSHEEIVRMNDWREISKKRWPHCWNCEPNKKCTFTDPMAMCSYIKKRDKCCKYPEGGKPRAIDISAVM